MALLPLLAASACDRRPDTGQAVVSGIGFPAKLADPRKVRLDTTDLLFADATAEGLIRFDAAGQIEPGLAERWIVIDGGMSYIFRLREARWADGSAVTADQVVEALTGQIAAGSRNPLAPFLTAISEVVVMTPQVIEIRLMRPRPDLLKMFAQPELAIWPSKRTGGAGPMRVVVPGRSPLLRPAIDPLQADAGDQPATSPEDDVRLLGESAARAIVRFAAHKSDLVAGGSFVDWPLVGMAGVAPVNIQLDPAVGLFGLTIVNREGFLSEPANRDAVNQAIDREALVQAVRSGWESTTQILPDALDSAAPPAVPVWAATPLNERRATARAHVAAWRGDSVMLRIAMPEGPGSTIVFGQIAASLHAIGIATTRVALRQDADLRLVDAVAPYDSARWYLANACALCGDAAKTVLLAARDASTLAERSRLIAAADVALRDDVAFIPIARPLRWALVALRLAQWHPNSRAWHPLNRLRTDTR
ncbi:MAG: ABC transporter substrate-binding protein [Pseudomonadota bacterium]|nr:ABC transporter substrate-binding protein [Pseudomonadota bacterium]